MRKNKHSFHIKFIQIYSTYTRSFWLKKTKKNEGQIEEKTERKKSCHTIYLDCVKSVDKERRCEQQPIYF